MEYNELEYNRLCAEFLGYEISDNKKCFKGLNKNGWIQLNIFHSDWNWIMSVVEKIETLELNQFSKQLGRQDVAPIDGELYLKITNDTAQFLGNVYYWQIDNDIEGLNEHTALTKKEAVVLAIWEFLNWYNLNKTQ